jgi:WD40 repeat protein
VNSTLKEDNIRGLTSISISRLEDKILVNQIDHTLALYDLNKMHKDEPVIYRGLRSSLYVRSTLSPCSRFIASGSADQGLHIWQADKPGDSLVKLYGGHTGEVFL